MSPDNRDLNRKRTRTRAFSAFLLALLALSLVAVFPIRPASASSLNSLCRESFLIPASSSSATTYTFTINAGTVTSGTCDSTTYTTFNSAIIEVTTWSSSVVVVSASDSFGDTFSKAQDAGNSAGVVTTGATATSCNSANGFAASMWFANLNGTSTTFTVNYSGSTVLGSGYGDQAAYTDVELTILGTHQYIGVVSHDATFVANQILAKSNYPNLGFQYTGIKTYTVGKPMFAPANSFVIMDSIVNPGACSVPTAGGTPTGNSVVAPLVATRLVSGSFQEGIDAVVSPITQSFTQKVSTGVVATCNDDETEPFGVPPFPDEDDNCVTSMGIIWLAVVFGSTGLITNTVDNTTTVGGGSDDQGHSVSLVANTTYLYLGRTTSFGGIITQVATRFSNISLTGTSDTHVKVAIGVYETQSRVCQASTGTCRFVGNLDPITGSNPLVQIGSCTTIYANHVVNQPLSCTVSLGLLNDTQFALGLVVEHSGVKVDATHDALTMYSDSADAPDVNGIEHTYFAPQSIVTFTPSALSPIFLSAILFVPSLQVTTTLTTFTTTTFTNTTAVTYECPTNTTCTNTLTTTLTCQSGSTCTSTVTSLTTTTTTCAVACSSITLTFTQIFSTNTTSVIVHNINSPDMSQLNRWLLPMAFVFAPYFLVLILVLRFNGTEEKAIENALIVSTITSWCAFGFDRNSPDFMPIYLPLGLTFLALLYFWKRD